MKKILLLLLLWGISIQTTEAQSTQIYHKVSQESMELKFVPQYPTSSLPNFFIDEIAKAIPKIRMYVKVDYQYQLDVQIEKSAAKYLMKAKILHITYGGHYQYKNFDFSQIIAPKRIEQTFIVKDLSSNETHYQKITLDFNESDSAQTFIKPLKGVITYKVNVRPTKVKYIYDENQKVVFQEAIQSIDDYYDDEIKLEAIQKRVEAVNFDQADLIALQNIDLNYIEKDFKKLKIDQYKNRLNLTSYDPIRLLSKYDSTRSLIQYKRAKMDQKMGRLDYFYFTQAQEKINSGDTVTAIEFYEKSIDTNPYFSPSIYQLAKIDYQRSMHMETFDKLGHILNELKPDQELKTQVIELCYLTYDSVMKRCLTLNREENYGRSLELLYKTQSFCDSTKYISCDARVDQYISQAIYGLYSSYLSIARASLDKGRLDLCQDYLKMAFDFHERNQAKLLGKTEEANKITASLIERLIQQSEYENQVGNSTKALQLVSDAKALCLQNPNTGCKALINKKESAIHNKEYKHLIDQSLHYQGADQTQKRKSFLSLAITYQQLHSDYIPNSMGTDTIIGKVRHMMYQEYIQNGLRDLEYKQYRVAYQEFEAAKELEIAYVFPKDLSLAHYLQQAAKPVILEILDEGQLKAWGKYYSEAALLLDSADRMSTGHNLTQDSEIRAKRLSLQGSLKESICEKLTTDFNLWIKKANASLRFDDFYYAGQYWNQAYYTATQLPHCQLDSTQVLHKLKKYHYDISYKTDIHYADSLKQTNTNRAFSYLVKAEETRINSSTEMQSKRVNSLLQLLIQYNIPALNMEGIQYFNQEKQSENASKLMIYALESNQVLSQALIEETAQLLAISDMGKGDPEALAEKRFGTKKSLQGFKKAYRKASKR